MEILLSQGDRDFQQRCQTYARERLGPLAEQLGEINDVPQALKESLGASGIYGPLFPEKYGGEGVVKGSVVERLYREIRPLRIYEGTSEIQKLIIANHLLKKEKKNGSAKNKAHRS